MNDEEGIIFCEKELCIVKFATVLQEWQYELNYQKAVWVLIVSK